MVFLHVGCGDCGSNGSSVWLVTSATRLYDKRMQSCYDGIPIVRYTHISSVISPFAGYNILVSQLHRFQALITPSVERSSFVMETAKLLVRMEARGYNMGVLRKKLHRHVHRYYYFVGGMSPVQLLTDIWNTVDDLQTMRADGDDWEHLPPASCSDNALSLTSADEGSGNTDSEMEELVEFTDV
jgi:hypothetical protein